MNRVQRSVRASLAPSATKAAAKERRIQAITFADIPVMAAYLCLISLIFVVINLVVDLLYFVVDPRLRVGGSGAH